MTYVEARPCQVAGAESNKTGLRWFMLLILICVLVFAVDFTLRTENLPVRQVRFEGVFHHVTRDQIEAAVRDAVRGNFLLLDLEAIKHAVEALPWVYRASVRRHWPQDVYIQFVEQRLVARWGGAAWLNHEGEVVRLEPTNEIENLPRLDGPAGTGSQVLQRYEVFNRLLKPAGLHITQLSLTPRHSWRLRVRGMQGETGLEGGMVLLIDRVEPEHKVQRFVRAYGKTLASQGSAVRRVDLRYTNGFAVEWVNGRSATTIHNKRGQPNAGEGRMPLAANEG